MEKIGNQAFHGKRENDHPGNDGSRQKSPNKPKSDIIPLNFDLETHKLPTINQM